MSRIIAGLAKSRRLLPAAASTRPTSDRVRESLFGKLDATGAVTDAKVLDLYSGTGALGLEAASRGAQRVVLVEKNGAALKVIAGNVAMLNQVLDSAAVECPIEVVAAPVASYLARSGAESFDLIFADPPYDLSDQQLAKDLSRLSDSAAANSLLVIERAAKASECEVAGFSHVETKTFGDTALQFLQRD